MTKSQVSTHTPTPVFSACLLVLRCNSRKMSGNESWNELDLFLPHGEMGLKYKSSWLRGKKITFLEFRSCCANMLHYIPVYSCVFLKDIFLFFLGYISRSEMLDQKIRIFHILVDTTKSTSKITCIFFLLMMFKNVLCLMPLPIFINSC